LIFRQSTVKAILEQRIANMTAAQAAYTEKQEKTLGDESR
jgi:hypothetical protein